jgi:hypothetical protein
MSPRQSGQGGDEHRMDLSSLTGDGNKALGPRAILVDVLPAALLTLLTLLLVGSGAPGNPELSKLEATINGLQSGPALALLGIVVLVATVILQPFQIGVVQLLEGYWAAAPDGRMRSAVAKKAIGIATELQRRRFRLLEAMRTVSLTELERAQLELELEGYPEPSKLMPTRLGNVLKAGEQRAGGRYGLDADLVFPHLYPFLRQPFQAAWDDLTNQLDSAAHLFVTFVLAAMISAGLLLPGGRDGWWLMIPPVFVFLAWLCYRSTIAAARYQSRLLAAAFDLHRFDLLTAMRLQLPKDPEEELLLNRQVMEMVQADLPGQATRRQALRRHGHLAPWAGYRHPETAGAGAQAGTEPGEAGPLLWEWNALLGGDGGNGEKKVIPEQTRTP